MSNTVWSGFDDALSVVTVISSTNDALNDPEYFDIIGPWAAQCVLYFCDTSVVLNGNLDEQIISTYFNESAQSTNEGYNLTQQPCLTELESGNSTYSVDENEPQDVVYSTCDFFVSPLVLNSIQQ